MQSEQLPTEGQVFEDEILAGAKRADNPPEEMPERNNHGKNIIGTIRIQLCAKSFILQEYRPARLQMDARQDCGHPIASQQPSAAAAHCRAHLMLMLVSVLVSHFLQKLV